MVSVLDTSALLAALQGEPGQEQVDAALLGGECCMSTVNLAEFAGKCLAGGLADSDLERLLAGFNLTIHAFDCAQALTTGKLRAMTRHLGLSLGDRACLALAIELNATVITADRLWTQVAPLGIRIDCIRPDRH